VRTWKAAPDSKSGKSREDSEGKAGGRDGSDKEKGTFVMGTFIVSWDPKAGKLLLSDDLLEALDYPARLLVAVWDTRAAEGGITLTPCEEGEGSKVNLQQRRPRIAVSERRNEELGLQPGRRYRTTVQNGVAFLLPERK
jgi:hypothetical protein